MFSNARRWGESTRVLHGILLDCSIRLATSPEAGPNLGWLCEAPSALYRVYLSGDILAYP